jgi:hypothetical protein
MSWENEEYLPEHFQIPPRPRVWQENISALAQVTPTGRLSTTNPETGKTVELNPNVESHIMGFLAPPIQMKSAHRTPAKLIQSQKFLRNAMKGAKNMQTRRNIRNLEAFLAEQEELNRPRREAAAAAEEVRRQAEIARQAEANRRAQYNEFIRNTNLRASPGYQQIVRERQEQNARIASRARRGMTNNKGRPSWVAKWKRNKNKSRKRKN